MIDVGVQCKPAHGPLIEKYLQTEEINYEVKNCYFTIFLNKILKFRINQFKIN